MKVWSKRILNNVLFLKVIILNRSVLIRKWLNNCIKSCKIYFRTRLGLIVNNLSMLNRNLVILRIMQIRHIPGKQPHLKAQNLSNKWNKAGSLQASKWEGIWKNKAKSHIKHHLLIYKVLKTKMKQINNNSIGINKWKFRNHHQSLVQKWN